MYQQPSIVGQSLRRWRKTKKISQLDLALEANVSARHISFIETGKTLPTREMLLALADAMRLQPEERNSFLVSAGFAADVPKVSWDSDEMASIRQTYIRFINQLAPYPAAVLDHRFDMVAKNSVFDIVDEIMPVAFGKERQNMFELLVSDDGFKQIIENWPDVQRFAIARFREITFRHQDPHLLNLLAKVTKEYEEEQGVLASDDILQTLDNLSVTIHLNVFGQSVRLTSFLMMPGRSFDILAQDLYVISLVPADDQSEQMLNMMYQMKTQSGS